jgi:hypothetical protein
MKNIPLILLSIILFATACKKDDPEPIPLPSPVVNSVVKSTFDKKTIYSTHLYERKVDSTRLEFSSFPNYIDSVIFYGAVPTDTFFNSAVSGSSKINFIDQYKFNLNGEIYLLTGVYSDSTYWVFSRSNLSDTFSSNIDILNNLQSLQPIISYTKGSTNINYGFYFPSFTKHYYEGFTLNSTQIHLPINNSDSVFILNTNKYLSGDPGKTYYYLDYDENDFISNVLWSSNLLIDPDWCSGHSAYHLKKYYAEYREIFTAGTFVSTGFIQ